MGLFLYKMKDDGDKNLFPVEVFYTLAYFKENILRSKKDITWTDS